MTRLLPDVRLKHVLLGAALFVGSGALILLALVISYVATGEVK